jgi:hypothetical protein
MALLSYICGQVKDQYSAGKASAVVTVNSAAAPTSTTVTGGYYILPVPAGQWVVTPSVDGGVGYPGNVTVAEGEAAIKDLLIIMDEH